MVVLCIGVITFLGWITDNLSLTKFFTGTVSMNPLTAACFIMMAAAVLIFSYNKPARSRNIFPAVLSGITGLTGLIVITDYIVILNFHIDQLMFSGILNGNRMAPNTAFNFILAGSSLVLLISENKKIIFVSHIIAALISLVAFLAFLGYIYNVLSLYTLGQYIGMAINTSVSFILLGISILSLKNTEGLMKIITDKHIGGLFARRFIPVAVLVPVILGWIRLYAQETGIFTTTAMATAIYAAAIIMFFLITILVNGHLMNRLDAKRMKAEEELSEAVAYVKKLYDGAPCGYHSINNDGIFVEANNTFLKWLGYTRDEFIGRKRIQDVLISKNSEGIEKDFESYKKTGSASEVELECKRKDGSVFPILLNSTAVKDDSGRFLHSITSTFDITERKKAEHSLSLLNRQLEDSNNELAAFSYSVSHDLRAPLRHVIGFSEKLSRISPSQNEEEKRITGKIISSAKNMSCLIDDLLMFSRTGRTELNKQELDTVNLVNEIIENIKPSLNGRNIIFKVEKLPRVLADKLHLRLVFENLILNSVKYTLKQQNPVVIIGCYNNTGDEQTFFVKDNGAGFDMKYSDKLFNVFQRLHADKEYEGTGIGLATVRRIIHRHGGRTWAEGKVNEGAIFYFSLPVKN